MKITKKNFNDYRKVEFSLVFAFFLRPGVFKCGVKNMFAIDIVTSLSRLTKEQCLDIMKNYEKYEKKFGEYDQ